MIPHRGQARGAAVDRSCQTGAEGNLIPRPGTAAVASFDFAMKITCDSGSANYLSLMSSLTAKIQRLGAAVIGWMQNLGKAVIFTATATLMIFTPPFRGRRIIEHLYFIGVLSILVVSLTAFFTGMVLGLQGYYTLSKFGSEGLLGSAVALSLIRELGPVLAALMVTGRAGSAVAANLGPCVFPNKLTRSTPWTYIR